MQLADIYWLAGLLEGEGCFGVMNAHKVAYVKVGMTDQDVIERAADLLQTDVQTSSRLTKGNKTVWNACIYGYAAREWMRILLPLMGARRATKIAQVLATTTPQPREIKIARCHPDRKHVARGKCASCYQRWNVARRKEAA